MLSARSIAVSYVSGKVSAYPLVDVNLDVAAGEAVALMGPSGSGKSTLLRVLSGGQRPDRGTVRVGGVPLACRRGQADPRVALVHQDYRLIEFLTARENLRLAMEVRGLTPDRLQIMDALDAVGLAAQAESLPDELSGGEKQRVALARAVVAKASVVLADEPTGALDRDNSRSVAMLLRGLAAAGTACVVVATHDDRVADLMDRTIDLADGLAVSSDGEQ